jgi:hypothetical protein
MRRAALVVSISSIVAALAVVIFLMAGERKLVAPHGARANESDARFGSIVFMPLVGNTCRQSVLDNNSGTIRPAEDISCVKSNGHAQNNSMDAAPTGGVMAIGEIFRK